MYGIDAPETEKRNRKTGRISKQGQPFGEEAFQALKGKIGGRRVTVEVRDIDRYRRAVSVLRLGGRDINQEMVREGFAWAYRQYLERPYASEYIRAEEDARRERRGLWRLGNPQPPWEFRKGLRGPALGERNKWKSPGFEVTLIQCCAYLCIHSFANPQIMQHQAICP